MQFQNEFTKKLGIEYPLICGAMYPCGNPELVAAVSEAGAIGIIQPLSLTYVYGYELKKGLDYIRTLTKKPVGMNILVEKSSKIYEDRMREVVDTALEYGVRFFITALGNPRWVVEKVHAVGGTVFHDVTEKKWAVKALETGVDGLICVNNLAGGHAGTLSPEKLRQDLLELKVPLVCAGGVGNEKQYLEMMKLGYLAVQMGTRFIATTECKASDEYKKAIIEADPENIVLTDKISGVPVSVIRTPFVDRVGIHAGPVSRFLLKHPRTKHWMRLFYSLKSFRNLKRSMNKPLSYRDYWQAGKSVSGIQNVEPAGQVVQRFAKALGEIKPALVFLLFFQLKLAAAGPFVIQDRTTDLNLSNPSQQAIYDALNQSADGIEDTVNNGFLTETTRTQFVTGMALASTSSTSSLHIDRASNPKSFLVSAGGQVSFYSPSSLTTLDTKFQPNSLPDLGAAGQLGLTLGFSGRTLGIEKGGGRNSGSSRWMFYLSAFSLSKTISDISVSSFTFGVNASYKLIPEAKAAWAAGWGGLLFASGINYASSTFQFTTQINQSKETTVASEVATVSVAMDTTVGANTTLVTIPLELSTNATLLSFLTLYAGGSLDINFGSSKLVGRSTGPVTAEYSQPVPGVENLFSGTAVSELDDGLSRKPTFLSPRAFLGVQLNIWALRIAVEGSALGNGTKSVSGLLKIAL